MNSARAFRRSTLLALASVALSGCAPLLGARALETASPGHTTYHEIRVGTRWRGFLLHLPPVAASRRVPLVLMFHGHHSNAAIARASTNMDSLADRYGMAVAYLEGTGVVPHVGLAWNAVTCCGYAVDHQVDDIAFAVALADTIEQRGYVQHAPVFAAGFSAGGMMALRLACEQADRIAAVADVAGAMPDTTCAPAKPVSVLFIRGGADDDLRIDHAMHAARAAPRPFSTSFENAVGFWSTMNGCSTVPQESHDNDVGAVVRRHCAGDTSVELLTIKDHPHAWPGGHPSWFFGAIPSDRLHASAFILAFFARHARATP